MFIDSHCHLDFNCFCFEFDHILAHLEKEEIGKVVIPATQRSAWTRIQSLCKNVNNLYYGLGIHPHFLHNFEENDLNILNGLLSARDNRCVAVGEIGLDKYAEASTVLQESVLIKQLKIAKRFKLPVILHVVKRQGRILEILKAEKFSYGGVYHAFSGSYEVAMEFIKLGFKLGIGGVITYPQSKKTRDVISLLPIESLLLETDAPDMPLYQQKEVHNSPTNLPRIFDSLCRVRSEDKMHLATQIYKNTQQIFTLDND